MALKECECGEMVAETKAFCPACGHAFVDEETRREKSKFDSLDNTVQLGQTMFGNMLSDMGLNISKKAAGTPEKKIEVIAPAAETAKPVEPAKPAPPIEPVKPAVRKPAAAKSSKADAPVVVQAKPSGRNRLYAIAGGLVILIWLLILAAAGFMFWYSPRSGNF